MARGGRSPGKFGPPSRVEFPATEELVMLSLDEFPSAMPLVAHHRLGHEPTPRAYPPRRARGGPVRMKKDVV
jgi:hypothetical protein